MDSSSGDILLRHMDRLESFVDEKNKQPRIQQQYFAAKFKAIFLLVFFRILALAPVVS